VTGWEWKVRAIFGVTPGEWSEVRTFNVEPVDTDCPSMSGRVATVSGSWDGTTYRIGGLFTVAGAGPVDATVTVSGFTGPLHLALLGFNPQGGASTCNTEWLAQPVPWGPTTSAPTLTGHWDALLPGTYCLNVASSVPFPPNSSPPYSYPPPYSWDGTLSYP
jgi:hypothetical protein